MLPTNNIRIRFAAAASALLSFCFLLPCNAFYSSMRTCTCTTANNRNTAAPRVFVLPGDDPVQTHDPLSPAGMTSAPKTRRAVLADLVASTSVIVVGGSVASSQPAYAGVKGAQGAAEYDLEYYMRDLVRGNTKEGNLPASAPPPVPPPRTLRGPLLPLLLDTNYSETCVPVKALSEVSGKSPAIIAEVAADYRSKAAKAFAAKAQWKAESVSDQYYFDLSCYALWRAAADLIPDYKKRDKFARDVGRMLYSESISNGIIKKKALLTAKEGSSDDDSSDDSSEDKKSRAGQTKSRSKVKEKGASSVDSSDDAAYGSLTGTIPSLLEVLDIFNSTGFYSSYRLGGDDESRQNRFVFDELDDDDIDAGSSVDCLISIYEPAVLSSALQITGEGSRFSPDYVGSFLSAVFEKANIKTSYESYFVDPVYRPNPKDFFPTERLIQFTLKKA